MQATPRPPGRLTLPSQLLTDKHFVYTKAINTDITQTMRRAREQLVNQQLQQELREIAQQALLPGITPMQQAPVQRVRAGIGRQVSLPAL